MPVPEGPIHTNSPLSIDLLCTPTNKDKLIPRHRVSF